VAGGDALLAARLRGPVELSAPLARYTSFGVGGPARLLATPADEADLQECLRLAASQAMPLLVLGGGSNLLVRDGGFPGMVVRMAAFRDPPGSAAASHSPASGNGRGTP